MMMDEILRYASTGVHPWWGGDDTPEEQRVEALVAELLNVE